METKMYRRQKGLIVTIFSLLLIPVIFFWYINNKYLAGHPERLNDFQIWGRAFFKLIPIMIGGLILIHIVFFIINKILTNEVIPTITDEMDKLIDLKAIKLSRWINSLGFLLAMGSQAIGMQPWIFLVTIMASGILSGIFEGVLKIYFYRKGL
ncbi:MAG: hypothetical protein JXB17_04295 [Bacteroidales bacterium]|nr:hypothetical protein [Bacteroidales bacterium]